ncbi:MAG: hypothetical protein H6710_01195 [Myxococcales bacterium]|nr:hypothetical protein [Myxococcales bacterium]
MHLNLPLRKPLFPEAAPPPRAALPASTAGAAGSIRRARPRSPGASPPPSGR